MSAYLIRIATLVILISFTLEGCFGSGIVRPETGVGMIERIRECRALDAKVTGHGSLAATGAFLSGGTGFAAALPQNANARQWVGFIALSSGVFSAVTSYLSQRNNDRYTARHCDAILGPDFDQEYFRTAIANLRDPEFGPRARQVLIDSVAKATEARLRHSADSVTSSRSTPGARLPQ